MSFQFNFLDDYPKVNELSDMPEVYAYRDKLLADILAVILEPGYTTGSDSLFCGKAGYTYLFLLHDIPPDELKKRNFNNIEEALLFFISSTVSWGQLPRQQCSLLHGRLGILLVYTILRWRANLVDENVFNELREIEETYKIPAGVHHGYEFGEGCTWGSGMCGHLFALVMLLETPHGQHKARDELTSILKSMSTYTIKHLRARAQESPFPTTLLETSRPKDTLPLILQKGNNNDTEYLLGGAEGLMGILYVLMVVGETLQAEWMSDVETSIECVMTMETCTADMPKDIGHVDEREPETSFLTGAASAVFLLCKAAQTFPAKKAHFLGAAARLGDTCWVRGIRIVEDKVKVDLYRGITGNGFALLRLYEATRQNKWLHRAQRFALLLKDTLGPVPVWEARNTTLTPAPLESRRPFGMFDGIAGVVCFFTACEKSYKAAIGEYTGKIPNIPMFDL